MTRQLLIAGGGIGGLSAAIGARRAGWQVRLYEQAQAFTEVGAGLQLGPNATRLLQAWGLGATLQAAAAFPRRLRVRCAGDHRELGCLRLDDMAQRYGAPYATLHRADLHGLLAQAAGAHGASIHLGTRITGIEEVAAAVQLFAHDDRHVEGDALVGADGLWSSVRGLVCSGGDPAPTGHLAFRTLLLQAALPAPLRSGDVQAWLGPRLHAVAYPVRGGELLNLVVFAEGRQEGDARDWDHPAEAAALHASLGATCRELRDLIAAAPGWRSWVLADVAPLSGPHQMARQRIALLGDAAHAMRPYLAQGAAMAIEDAAALGQQLAAVDGRILDVPDALRRYALQRWQRCARVQGRSRRNGVVFHAAGPLRLARNAAMALLGRRLLDQPWLYGGVA